MSRRGEAFHPPRAIQNYAEATGSVSGSSGRTCAACGARMRRGHDMHRTTCDPCYAVTHPYEPPDPPPAGPDRCAWCERPYTAWSPQQRYCSMNCSEKCRAMRHRKQRSTQGTGTINT